MQKDDIDRADAIRVLSDPEIRNLIASFFGIPPDATRERLNQLVEYLQRRE
jgi:hypothetical protein